MAGCGGIVDNRILLVEDDASLARSIAEGLSDEGFTVAHAADGNAARDALRAGVWDLVILDWWLPGVDGLEVLKGHRREGGNTPVLFLTARDAVSDRVHRPRRRRRRLPMQAVRLRGAAGPRLALIRRRHPVEVMTLSYRDLRVDLAAQKAERAGHPLNLTAKELALLVFFLRHPGEVLSRTRIYGHVWGEDYDFVSNTLDVHVKELRRALETRGPRLLHTVRGRGYLLGDPPRPAAEEGA